MADNDATAHLQASLNAIKGMEAELVKMNELVLKGERSYKDYYMTAVKMREELVKSSKEARILGDNTDRITQAARENQVVNDAINESRQQDVAFLDSMSRKYNVILDTNRRIVISERERLKILRESSNELDRRAAQAIDKARTYQAVQKVTDLTTSALKFGSPEGMLTAQEGAAGFEKLYKTGLESKGLTGTWGGAMGSLMTGDLTKAGIEGVTALLGDTILSSLKVLPHRMQGWNLAQQMGYSDSSAFAEAGGKVAGTSHFYTALQKRAAQLQLEYNTANEATIAALSRVPGNIDDFIYSTDKASINLQTVRDNANLMGISEKAAADIMGRLYQSHIRSQTATDANDLATLDMASMRHYGAAAAADGIMSQDMFNESVMSALEATNDYTQSADQVARMIRSIQGIKGAFSVAPAKQGAQAASLISGMQNMSPELVMAMTGGGLGAAYEWAGLTPDKQEAMMNKAFGGLFSGAGKGSADKMVSSLFMQSFGIYDARTARTKLEKSPMEAFNEAALTTVRDQAVKTGKTVEDLKDNVLKLLNKMNEGLTNFKNLTDNNSAVKVVMQRK